MKYLLYNKLDKTGMVYSLGVLLGSQFHLERLYFEVTDYNIRVVVDTDASPDEFYSFVSYLDLQGINICHINDFTGVFYTGWIQLSWLNAPHEEDEITICTARLTKDNNLKLAYLCRVLYHTIAEECSFHKYKVTFGQKFIDALEAYPKAYTAFGKHQSFQWYKELCKQKLFINSFAKQVGIKLVLL